MLNLVVLTFAIVLGLVFGCYWLLVRRPEDVEKSAVKKRLRPVMVGKSATGAGLQKQAERLSAVGPLNALLVQRNAIVAPLARLVQQSGKNVTVGTLLLGGGTLFLAVTLLVQWSSGYLSLALVVGALAGSVPYVWIKHAATKRLNLFEQLFPEALDLIIRALKAGHALTTGLSMVAEEMPEPVSTEFRDLYDRQNYGLPLPDGLREMAANVPLLDVKFFVTAVLTQREAGGNLAEVLENLSAVVRDRFMVKREVRTKSAHARATGWVLAGLPPSLALVFFVTSPLHMQTLINDPIGVRMIVGAIVLQVIGTLIIRRMVDIEY
jgi:tight adherence protein B